MKFRSTASIKSVDNVIPSPSTALQVVTFGLVLKTFADVAL